ncbi:MAG: hypothetical protein ACHQM6_01390 [Candidatus Kapaibacterium sp.]
MKFKKTVGYTVISLAFIGIGYFILPLIERHHIKIQDITSTTTVMPGVADNTTPLRITMRPYGSFFHPDPNDVIIEEYSNNGGAINFRVTSPNANAVAIDSNAIDAPIRYYRIISDDGAQNTTLEVQVSYGRNTYATVNEMHYPNDAPYILTEGYYTGTNFAAMVIGDEQCFGN